MIIMQNFLWKASLYFADVSNDLMQILLPLEYSK